MTLFFFSDGKRTRISRPKIYEKLINIYLKRNEKKKRNCGEFPFISITQKHREIMAKENADNCTNHKFLCLSNEQLALPD